MVFSVLAARGAIAHYLSIHEIEIFFFFYFFFFFLCCFGREKKIDHLVFKEKDMLPKQLKSSKTFLHKLKYEYIRKITLLYAYKVIRASDMTKILYRDMSNLISQ